MKVLHVYKCYYPDQYGGVEQAIKQIILSVKNFDVESKVFVLSKFPIPESIHLDGVEVIRGRVLFKALSCDIGVLSTFTLFNKYVEWADVIHYQYPWPFADLLQIFSRTKKPFLVTYQSDVISKGIVGFVYNKLTKYFLQKASFIISTSSYYRDSSKILNLPSLRKKVHVVPLGVENTIKDHVAHNLSLGISDLISSKPFALFIGAFRSYKDIPSLIHAAEKINGNVILLGGGNLESGLKKLTTRLGLKNVYFLKDLDDYQKSEVLKKSRVLVLPSNKRSEAFGMVLVEASMHSKPMVTCLIDSGTRFINIDGETGFVVPPNSPADLAKAINLFMDDCGELSNKMGNMAKLRYEKYFDGSQMGEKYYKFYTAALSSNQAIGEVW